jgi:hypothetical protein
LNLSLERLDFLRRRALDEPSAGEPSPAARSTALSREEEAAFVVDLRQEYGINHGASFARMERITRMGFTLSEQVVTLETALRIMGLTGNFARLVLLCATAVRRTIHLSSSTAASGGNPVSLMRVVAIMANRPLVRALAKGILIPQDTYFIAGQHRLRTRWNSSISRTSADPPQGCSALVRDLEKAGARNTQNDALDFLRSRLRCASKARREVRAAAATGAKCVRNGACPAMRPLSSGVAR